jgi:uncharacterized protein YjiS (DUF1127 family)
MVRNLIAWINTSREVSATRRKLGRLDDGLLGDIGITRAQAEAEMSRPFWDHGRRQVRVAPGRAGILDTVRRAMAGGRSC